MTDKWQCAGCGIASEDRERRCDCPTEVLFIDGKRCHEVKTTPLSAKIERELNEMMMGVENYFGAENPKRSGHIRCALDRIMAHLESSKQHLVTPPAL